MRILVVSDSHGDAYALERAVDAQPTARVVIHLGDGAREAADAAEMFPDRTFYQVRGNCDWSGSCDAPYTRQETLGGKSVFFTHGHLYDVKMGLYRAVCAARERKADILLFGHTHEPLEEYDEGLYILNPGSLSRGRGAGTYGILDITPAGIVTHIVENRL